MVAENVAGEFLPELDLDNPARQRRWTVLLRLILLVPQFVVVWALSIVAHVVTIIGWFAALVLGRLPDWVADYLSGYLAWTTRVNAYLTLVVDAYPPFEWEPADPAVRIEVRPGRLNRLAVLFRVILAIPATILAGVLGVGWAACAFFCWLVVLVMGRTPVPLFGASVAFVRYEMRYQAYWMMLTSAYPKGLFGEDHPENQPDTGPDAGAETRRSGTRPLLLTAGGRGLLILFIVVGVLAYIGDAVGNSQA